MRRLLLAAAFAATALGGIATPALAAPHERHICPPEARGTVSHNGQDGWTATNQSSRVLSARVAPIGGVVALVCVYHLYGGEYWIYKRPSPNYTNCGPEAWGTGQSFWCGPT